MHVQCAPLSALLEYLARAVTFLHPQCVNAVRFKPLLHIEGANGPAGVPNARVECTARTPCAPARHNFAENVLNFEDLGNFFLTEMSAWHIAVPENCGLHHFLGTAIDQASYVP